MRGFTLVEIAVTILLIGLLLAFSVPAFRTVSNTYQLKGTTENVAAQVRMAREKAIATGQAQTVHLYLNTYDADYHIHNGGYVGAKWSFPVGILYYWGASTLPSQAVTMRPDGRAYDPFSGAPTSGFVILQDGRGQRDTVSIQASGLVLTK